MQVSSQEQAEGRRGEGSKRATVTFRDPPSREPEAAALRAEIARILVRAPQLPVDLPAFQIKLVDVQVEKRSIDLLFGWDSPVAALRLSAATPSPEAVVQLGRGPARAPCVKVTTRV